MKQVVKIFKNIHECHTEINQSSQFESCLICFLSGNTYVYCNIIIRKLKSHVLFAHTT